MEKQGKAFATIDIVLSELQSLVHMFKQWPLGKCPDVANGRNVANLTVGLNPTGGMGKGGGQGKKFSSSTAKCCY